MVQLLSMQRLSVNRVSERPWISLPAGFHPLPLRSARDGLAHQRLSQAAWAWIRFLCGSRPARHVSKRENSYGIDRPMSSYCTGGARGQDR